jgi:hypothetical protein
MCRYKFPCKLPAGEGKRSTELFNNFECLFLLFSLLFLLRENFWDFQIFCSSGNVCLFLHHTQTGKHTQKSIFSTPNDDGRRQWDGKKWKNFHYALFSIMNRRFSLDLVLHFSKIYDDGENLPPETLLFRFMISFKSQRDDFRRGRKKRCKFVALLPASDTSFTAPGTCLCSKNRFR